MADPKIQYEYGRTPEKTAPGVLGFFNLLSGPLVDAFTPKRREVITPSQTTYTEIDGMYYPKTTPGVYGPAERGIEYMPVVQGAKSAYEFLGELISSGKKRGETAEALVKGIATLLEDQKRAAINAGLGGDLQFYDPEQKRVVGYDPLLVPTLAAAGAIAAPVRGPGAVVGMFAGRNAATADPKKFARAEEMAEKGRSREEIWKETGLFRWERNGEPVSDWKFEVPGSPTVAFNPKFQTATGRLREKKNPVVSDIYSYPELFEAYPGARSMQPMAETIRDIADINEATKKLQVKYGRGDLTESAFREQYNLLLQQKANLIALSKGEAAPKQPVSVLSGLPRDYKGDLIFKTEDERMARPLSEIPLRKMVAYDKRRAGGYYAPSRDYIATGTLPGQPLSKSLQKIPWDEQGKYVQQFSSSQYQKALNKAIEDFKEAGISLSGTHEVFGKPEHRLRKLGGKGGPEDAINPETLPDYLKKQWDQLQEFGTIYYKKDYDPAEEFRGTMTHELQHGIQHRTLGDETGQSARNLKGLDIKDPETGKKLPAREIYMRKLGEMEARLSEARMDMTAKERNEKFPWTKEGGLDRRENDLILEEDIRAARDAKYGK